MRLSIHIVSYPEPPERWYGTVAQYFNTAPVSLSNILVSVSIFVTRTVIAYISHLLEPWTGALSGRVEYSALLVYLVP